VKTNLLSAVLVVVTFLPSAGASAQVVRNSSFQMASGDRVLRIESTIPASQEEVWKALTTPDRLNKWIAPVAAIDLHVGGSLSTNYDKAATIGAPGTIRMGILNYLEEEMITFRVTLNDRFSAKVRNEDGNLQEIVQIVPLPNGTTKVISSMVGWGVGKDWDDAFHFFAKGNEWTYQQLVKSFSKNRK
jgi:Activator of Hsp90 ATPase homolog 1-like protein